MSDLPFSQSVSEADIDWILCIELNADPELRSWLGERIFGFDPVHVRAWRSISDPLLGESDLVWLVAAQDGTRLVALIENKINALAQPLQYERYVRRGDLYRGQGQCASYHIVLVSPQAYKSADSSEYPLSISYEELRDRYASIGGERAAYVASLFEAALSKPSSLPPSPEVTAFRRQVWELARTEFPQLGLEEPIPTREYWVVKSYGTFSIKYKSYTVGGVFRSSVVDLELPGQAADIDALRAGNAADLSRMGAVIAQAGKSAAVRMEVPGVRPPEFDESATRTALQAWATLLSWWRGKNAVQQAHAAGRPRPSPRARSDPAAGPSLRAGSAASQRAAGRCTLGSRRASADAQAVRSSLPRQALIAWNFSPLKSASWLHMPWMAWRSLRSTATMAWIGFLPRAISLAAKAFTWGSSRIATIAGM